MLSLFFSIGGVGLSLLRYGTYIRAMIAGTTKPHPLTWLGAGLMCGIALVIQFMDNAGPTIWVSGVVTIFCMGIGTAACFVGEKDITLSDWASFTLAILAVGVWLVTSSPLLALILVLLIEVLNYYPTVRKSYSKPWDEDIVSWGLSALRWLFATLAITNITLNSFLYPAFLTTCEIGFVAYLFIRRKMLAKPAVIVP